MSQSAILLEALIALWELLDQARPDDGARRAFLSAAMRSRGGPGAGR